MRAVTEQAVAPAPAVRSRNQQTLADESGEQPTTLPSPRQGACCQGLAKRLPMRVASPPMRRRPARYFPQRVTWENALADSAWAPGAIPIREAKPSAGWETKAPCWRGLRLLTAGATDTIEEDIAPSTRPSIWFSLAVELPAGVPTFPDFKGSDCAGGGRAIPNWSDICRRAPAGRSNSQGSR